MPSTHIDEYPSVFLKFSRLAGVTDHCTCLDFGGTCVNCQFEFDSSLHRTCVIACKKFNVLSINPTWMNPSAHMKVRMHIYLLWGDFCCFLGLFRGAMLGCIFEDLGLISGCILIPYVHFLHI